MSDSYDGGEDNENVNPESTSESLSEAEGYDETVFSEDLEENTEEKLVEDELKEDKLEEEKIEEETKNNEPQEKKSDEKQEIEGKAEGDKGNDDIFDKETGRFNTGCYGELNYDSESVKGNLYITNGMMNDNPSKATQSYSNNIRSSIQENAIESKLNEDKEYFKQFGCDKETPSAIRSWFSNNENYTLHETKEHTIQIMDAKIHASIHHDGGVAQEKSEMISADRR